AAPATTSLRLAAPTPTLEPAGDALSALCRPAGAASSLVSPPPGGPSVGVSPPVKRRIADGESIIVASAGRGCARAGLAAAGAATLAAAAGRPPDLPSGVASRAAENSAADWKRSSGNL